MQASHIGTVICCALFLAACNYQPGGSKEASKSDTMTPKGGKVSKNKKKMKKAKKANGSTSKSTTTETKTDATTPPK